MCSRTMFGIWIGTALVPVFAKTLECLEPAENGNLHPSNYQIIGNGFLYLNALVPQVGLYVCL